MGQVLTIMRAIWKKAMVDSGHTPDESFRVGEETHSRSLFPKTTVACAHPQKSTRKKCSLEWNSPRRSEISFFKGQLFHF